MVANPTQPVIEVRGLSKTFKDFWMRPRVHAVDALDLSIDPHQVFGLLGPNGSGKSTSIKIILGLLFPTKGRVAVFGKLPTDVSTKKRIGYLPEESYLYRFLNARETLDYYGRLFYQDRHTRNKRIDMLLEMVGLEAVQRRPVGEYSKGMQRRIGLAQALINDPDLLILDEPTTGMDPIGTRQIKDLILHLKERGKTVILSSHLLADVEDVCDRAVILYGGKKRAEGTIDELLTVDGTNLIETDALKPSTIARIERVIEEEEGKAIRKVDVPRQKLETLFLNIVHKAQQEGLATAGARMGGPVADFLSRDAHMPEDIDGDALIDQLTAPEAPVNRGSEAAADKEAEKNAASTVLNDLIKEEADRSARQPLPSEPQGTSESAKPKKPDVDRGVIDDLLGGKQ